MTVTTADIRRDANDAAQAALRDLNDYISKHGTRSRLLEERYEAAERAVDSLDELIRLDAMLSGTAIYDDRERWDAEWAAAVAYGSYDVDSGESHDPLPDIPLADPGDWFAGMPA